MGTIPALIGNQRSEFRLERTLVRTTKTFDKRGQLDIRLTRDELLIAGNREGLLSLASLIAYVAKLPYGSEGLEHEHVGFAWFEALLQRRLRIKLGETALTPPTKKHDSRGRDVTVMLTRKPVPQVSIIWGN
jgi:hypothetical protein